MKSDRLRYLLYRCYQCHRLLTHYEIVKVWEKAESGNPQNGLCPCGSGKITPSNAKLWEELFLPRVWKVWINDVIRPRLGL